LIINSTTKLRGQRIKARNKLIWKQYHTKGIKKWQLERVAKKIDKQFKGTQRKVAHKMEPKE